MKHLYLILRTLALPLALVAIFSQVVVAQTPERHTSLGLNYSALQYQGNFGSDYWKFSNSQYAPGVAINQYLTKGLDLNSQLFYTELKGQQSLTHPFTTTLINANLGLKFKLNNGWALKENARIQPYLLAASGWTYASQDGLPDSLGVPENRSYVDVMAGAGINFRLGSAVGFFVQSAQHMPLRANLDGNPEVSTPRWSDRFLQHTVGLTFSLGQAPDSDEDGVPDAKDKCPNTSPDIEVDERGCALDDDLDGVPNHQDQCPDQPGTAETHGCPDADNDGVDDTDDTCPDTPAGVAVDATGCPTTTTTDTTATATPPTETTDNDGDGVPNAEDRCPDHAGPATNQGCPEITAETRQRLQEATKRIGFELNKATLLPSSYATLDELAQLLGQYPDYSLSIAGHTDSRGPAAFNLRLSRERAAAARQYLLSKEVADTRVEMRGYGAAHPLATNTTEAGRTQNRRVEFDLFLTGDSNAAQVKYGVEPKLASAIPAKPKKAAPAKKSINKARKATLRKAPVSKAPARKTSVKKATPKAPAPKAPVRKAPAKSKPSPQRPVPAPAKRPGA
ncbi:Outer membrane protein OmpA [Hymenobacter gelipurpurascens]|uniref:Outer membrane protein OmpA n=1 Tax=Hymenobacter gelipurpurascens TaxID=89968 RepID=A0A212TLQ1_9BACT|nr:OmpA family protein [Hymenobacter gelipurpurascens]SNC66942.1 Outer membrane protein OmpA [Hymenobacter gelipurpurascens]